MAIITTEQQLLDAIAASDPQLTVANNITLTLPHTINYSAALTANGSVLTWNGVNNARMFSVVNGATLTIDNIVLEANAILLTFFSIQASTLVMNDGAILRNSNTIATVPALAIGVSTDLGVGGTFLMNGGLITGVRDDSVVNCWGGTITMSGNAAIAQNLAYGIYLQGGTLNMAGTARISGNTAARPAIGVRATAASVINMGLAAGDAPQISNNRSTNNSVGGVWLEGGSTLNMNYDASISGNTAFNMVGGVRLDGSTLNMLGNSAISGNTAQGGASGGGVLATAGSQVTMAANAAIFDNQITAANGQGGGILLLIGSPGSTLTMRENASIYGNSAARGGGLNIGGNNSLIMGVDATDTPSITGNSATVNGGGIYIGFGGAAAELSAQSRIAGNTAGMAGNGVYNVGTLRISQNIQIADGLYFDSEATAPVIVQALGANASIQLASSGYVDLADIPVVVAIKGAAYQTLTETDRAAFRTPTTFPPGIAAYLNAGRDQVLLGSAVAIQDATLSIMRIA